MTAFAIFCCCCAAWFGYCASEVRVKGKATAAAIGMGVLGFAVFCGASVACLGLAYLCFRAVACG